MKFKCPLIVVSDISRSRKFYEEVLSQTVKYDFGDNITFEGDFAIHEKQHFSRMVKIEEAEIQFNTKNSELYFEEENIEIFIEKLREYAGINYLHDLIEHPWGQRVIRFYDPDLHIVEVGECMKSVIIRFLSEGYSIKETSEITQHPVELVMNCSIN